VEAEQGELARALAEVARGDRRAFRLIYQRTAPKLMAAARRILGKNPAAEEAVQEAYVRIWRHAADFDARVASPIAWMTTIARHAAIDVVRSGPERVSAASGEIDTEILENLAGPGDAGAGDPLAAAQLSACLDGIEADRRTMVLLAYCNGWSREELARRFDRPVATIKTLLRRSLLALKECLGGSGR
jgi:RNA polymerase sigma-70 factor (ECF subfamily)